MLDAFPAIKETKRNAEGGGSGDYFMGPGGGAMKGRKMVPLTRVFPSNEGVHFLPSTIFSPSK